MNITILVPWVITVSILGLIPVGDSATVAAKSSAKADAGSAQTGRSHEASKSAKPKSTDPADQQPGIGPATPQNPTPANQTQIEERLRRGEMDEPSHQGRISDRLDQFYQGSENLPGRQAAGTPDR